MALGPKVQMINSGMAKPKLAPIAEPEAPPVAAPAPEPVIVHRQHWAHQLWLLILILACITFGSLGTLAITSTQFEQLSRAIFQADIAHKVLDKTAGN